MNPIERIANKSANQKADWLKSLYQIQGLEYYGEGVSQLQHASQAAMLALEHGADAELALAAGLHDIGHLLGEYFPRSRRDDIRYRHEMVGSECLNTLGFPLRVVTLVGSHANAKRYLTATDPAYARTLSAASVASMKFQGGPMTPDEVALFELRDDLEDVIHLRLWDDQAKDADNEEIDLDWIWSLSEDLLELQARAVI